MAGRKTRTELQALFKAGAKPKGTDFYDFIESVLNIKDDGIQKQAGADKPLRVTAQGKEENLLDFGIGDTGYTWRINQKPGGKKISGLNISNASGSKLFIDSSTGNVGVSNKEPNARLHISQTESVDALRVDDAENDTTPFIIDKDGNAGIGTKDPGAKLHVSGTTVLTNGTGDSWFPYSDGNSYISGTNLIFRSSDNREKMRLTGGGNLGIGTTNPGARLEITGDIKITGARIRGKDGFGIVETNKKDWLRVNPDQQYPAIALYKPVAIGTGGLAVGTWGKPPVGEIWGKNGISIAQGSRTTHMNLDGTFYRYRGQVYITVDDNLYIRDTDGKIRFHFDTNTGTLKTQKLRLGDKWLLSGDGDAEANDDWLRLKNAKKPRDYYGGFAASKFWTSRGQYHQSDLRLKKGIHTLCDSLNKLISLRGVSFKWKDKKLYTSEQLGLIAQEVEPIFPEVVETGPDNMKGINYAALMAPIIEAIKEQYDQNMRLQTDIKMLKDRLAVT